MLVTWLLELVPFQTISHISYDLQNLSYKKKTIKLFLLRHFISVVFPQESQKEYIVLCVIKQIIWENMKP